ncbi:MAG TPA: ABC transporter permease [bacterium]|nr:ABC transporter permease [bacterium]HPO10068.1 ABC transporter permease [bacterium]HQO33791.1 ABC transporter permease [bacterium]HQP99104.1 ABC transporter permease [bacterium]
MIKQIWQYRRLLRELVRRDLRTRYKVSILGFFWSLLRPLLAMAIIAVVFTYIAEMPHASFPHISYFAFLLCGYLPWTLLTGGLMEGTQALLTNAQLIKKVACPRLIFPLGVVLSHLVNTFLAFLVLLPLTYLVFGYPIPFSCLLLLPLLLCETLLVIGLVWALSGLNVLYRDVTQILDFLLLAWFYGTPIIYSIDMPMGVLGGFGLPGWLLLLNPMSGMIYAARRACFGLGENPPWAMPFDTFLFGVLFFVAVSLAAPVVGYAIFRRMETRAVDAL